MLDRKFTLGAAVATLALATWLGPGTAVAAGTAVQRPTSQAAMVLSDTITFSGFAKPVGPPPVLGVYTLTSNQCSQTSDAEPTAFPCTITLTLQYSHQLPRTGGGQVTSADGSSRWAFTYTPTGAGAYSVTGNCATSTTACTETESEGGVTSTNPVNVSGSLNIISVVGGLSVSGRVNLLESPTAP